MLCKKASLEARVGCCLEGDTFELQQGDFAIESAGITGQAAAGADNAVAGHDDTQGIASHGATHCAHGGRLAQDCAQGAITGGGAKGNSQQGAPYGLLKRGAHAQVQRQIKAAPLPFPIGGQLFLSFFEQGVLGCLLPVRAVGQVALLGKPESCQMRFRGRQQERPQRAVHGGLHQVVGELHRTLFLMRSTYG